MSHSYDSSSNMSTVAGDDGAANFTTAAIQTISVIAADLSDSTSDKYRDDRIPWATRADGRPACFCPLPSTDTRSGPMRLAGTPQRRPRRRGLATGPRLYHQLGASCHLAVFNTSFTENGYCYSWELTHRKVAILLPPVHHARIPR